MQDNASADFRQQFLAFALACDVLRFGEFVTKAGRKSPYFFNAGSFNDGESLRQLGGFYADALRVGHIEFDQLFGPAYKGITLAAATAMALAQKGQNVPYSFNRKEAKDHGEGGVIVGAPLRGRVVIVDDVITDGGAKREAIELVRAQGATPVAVLIAFDRKERGRGARSAVQELAEEFGIPVLAIATLDDLRVFIDATASAGRPGGRPGRLSRAVRCAMRRASTGARVRRPAGRSRALLLALAACAVAGTATAQQTYKWVDDKGVVHYTDKLPTEPLNTGATVLNKQAVPIRSIDAPLTPAQRAAKEEEQRRAAVAAKAREETERADRALMQSFSSEQEIMDAKARAISPLEGQIQAAQAYVSQLTAHKTELEARKAALGKKPMPDALEHDLESTNDELAKQAVLIDSRRQELVQTSAHYDAFALRWNEIKAACRREGRCVAPGTEQGRCGHAVTPGSQSPPCRPAWGRFRERAGAVPPAQRNGRV